MPLSGLKTHPLNIARLPGVRALFLFAILYVSAVQHLRSIAYRDPGSAFYDEERAFERWYSRDRAERAQAFLRAAGNSTQEHVKANSTPTICAAFSTVKRSGEQYVDVSASAAAAVAAAPTIRS
jgi:hypothetical protein